jgi:transposase InsO family protein
MKQLFLRYGIPDMVYSDNRPQFDCSEYKKIANELRFQHYTSLPYQSQSNGLIDTAMKTAKMLQKKAL